MLSTAGVELTSIVNSGSSLKVLKGSGRSSRRARRTVAKVSNRSSDLVCVNSGSYNMPISESEKHQGDVLGCHSSDKLEHLPIKKRRFLFRPPSPPPKIPSPVNEVTNFSKSQDDPVQSSVGCPVSCKSKMGTMSADKAGAQSNYPKKVNENLKSIEDFSGISILAAAACSSSLGREFGYAEDGSGVEEPSVHKGPVEVSTNSEAQSLSKGLVKEEYVNMSDISIGGTSSCVTTALAGEFSAISTSDCTSVKVENLEKSIKEPFHEDGTPTVSSDVSSMRDEDIVGSPKLQLRDDRLHWDLNVVMDAWEQPFDCQNAHISDHISQGSGIVVRPDANRKSAEEHDLLNEPESSTCDDKKKLLHYEPRKSLDQISQGNTRNQVDDQNVNMCGMSISSEYKNVMSSLGDGDSSVQPLLSKYVNAPLPIPKPFDIKKHADNKPTVESMNFDVAAPLFTDERNLFCPSVHDRNCVAQPTLDIENELTLKSTVLDISFDDRRQSLKENDATMEKGQKENDHPQRSAFLHEFTASMKEVKMASAKHLEEKLISEAPVVPCPTHEIEAAVRLQDDYDSQYEDGELIEPTGHVLEKYDPVNEKTEHVDYVFENSRYSITSTDHHDSNIISFSSARGVVNELCPESDRPITDDNDHGKDDCLLKLVHSGDEEMKVPASSEMLERNKTSSETVVRVRVDCNGKGRIYNLATRSPDSEGTDTRTGSILYRGGLPSQSEGPVGRDMSFREDQAGDRSKFDGVSARWDRSSSYIRSSERVRYPMQSQPRVHQVNSWNGSSDVRRGIKRNYSPTYHAQAKRVDGDDTLAKEDRDGTLNTAPYLSRPSTNDESIADVDVAGNFQSNRKQHGGLGSDRPMGRGRFIRYGHQMDHGAGRGRYHGPHDNTFRSRSKYRHPPSQRDRSYSPNERRGYAFAHQSRSRSSSPSRSRSRSPDPRVSPRGRSAASDCGGLYPRHESRSPNFRSEARMPRMRSPQHQQRFGADRMTGFRPFQRDHGSPPPSRWINNSRKDGHFNNKQRPFPDKSPNRIRLRGDRTDFSDSARNPKPDGYYRENNGRFSEMDATGRPHRLEENFENRRRPFGPNHNTRHGYENRDFDSRNGDMPRKFRRDASFVYERDGKFNSNSKQFGFGGMDSSRNFRRFNETDGAGRGQRYVDVHDERRRQYSAVYDLPRRGEMEGVGRRFSHDVDDNLLVPQRCCNDDARGIDGCVADLPTRQIEEQQLELCVQEEKKIDETSKSTDVEVPDEK